eukprot:12892710-Prorocentrum_lima.AAC.1
MLSTALQKIYNKEDASLMHLSEVRTSNATDLPARHYDRETICVNRAKTMDRIKALVLSDNLP